MGARIIQHGSVRSERNRGYSRAIPGKVRSGFPSGIAQKQKLRAVLRFHEKLNRSSA
uniref:Uncharacterized protein n=1 Tax=Rhizobium laguerreae TaxID=1076926 RepID=A0A6N9ZPH7_9HYPH|nr:hypothetical protein [Rhizobium laguerreae]